MPLSSEDRASFVSRLTSLTPGADAHELVDWCRDRRVQCLEELGAVPGHDQVRAGVLRILPAMVPDEADRLQHYARVKAVLEQVDFAAIAQSPAMAQRRNPAWMGLCALEWGAQTGETGAVAWALELARAAFDVSSMTGAPVGEGEVYWAMAEVAYDSRWFDHGDALLEAALGRDFYDEDHRHQVLLLTVLRLLDQKKPAEASIVLDALLELEVHDPQTLTHALWIGAQLDRQAGDVARAILRLERAMSLVVEEEEPDVARRIAEALLLLRGGGDTADA